MTDQIAAKGNAGSSPINAGRWLWEMLFDFSGRANRFDLFFMWMWRLPVIMILVLALVAVFWLAGGFEAPTRVGAEGMQFGFYALTAILILRPMALRFHDLGLGALNAVWLLWGMSVVSALGNRVPMITYTSADGIFYGTYPAQDWGLAVLCTIPALCLLALALCPGTKGPNRYGPQPE